MNYRAYKKNLLILTFVTIGAGVFITTPNHIVKSQRVAPGPPSPFKFETPTAFTRETRKVTGSSSPGSLEAKSTIDFSSRESAYAVAVQPDGKIVAVGAVLVGGNGSLDSDYDFAIFRYNRDGSLDTSFDADGKLTTSFGDGNDTATAILIQTDGKIIAAGYSYSANGFNSVIVKYNTDGSLDTSFGAGGRVITPGAGISEIAPQVDGKIVAVRGDFSVARYNTNGSLDASFGSGGVVSTSFEGSNTLGADSIAVQADGKVVVAGYAGNCYKDDGCYFDFALARYNTNGSADTSFDMDGKLTTAFGVGYHYANAVVVQGDGKIVAAGYATDGFAFARYNGDGSLDTSFDVDGRVTVEGGWPNSVVLQSDGKIVAAGGGGGIALARLNPDGSLDTSFDGDGIVTTSFGNGFAVAYDVDVQSDGRIVAAGVSSGGYELYDFALARYNINGSLDNSFDRDGKLSTSWLVVSSRANAIAVDPRNNYRQFAVGYSGNGANDDFAVASFASDGFLARNIIPIGNSNDQANAAAFAPNGGMFSAGYSYNGSNNDFALFRNFSGSSFDPPFGTNGRVTTDFGGANDEATAVAVQADNKIVAAGQTIINGTSALGLARYNQNGSLDSSFGTGGRVILQPIRNPKAMAIQPDGKIIAAGSVGPDFAIVRLNPNGSIDTAFGADGIAVTSFGRPSQITSVALQPYGKIVAAGFAQVVGGNLTEFAVARYNPDGSSDTSFDADGKVTTSFNISSSATAVRVQRNGKIVALGSALSNTTGLDFAVARFNINGSLDATFDTDGKQTTDFFGGDDIASAAAVQYNGSIVATGAASRDGRTDFAAARYTGDALHRTVPYDFDGDGLSDVSVFRPTDGVWYLNRSTEGFYATHLGISTGKLAPADYDADGKTDLALFSEGFWYLRTSRFSSAYSIHFGLPDDIPVPADYTGDGREEIAVYRSGVWRMQDLSNGQTSAVSFGLANDRPVPADYDGDGRTDQAVYRDGFWHINGSMQGYTVIHFGLPSDKPVVADYDGDGKADPAVYRDGTWYLLQSADGFLAFNWGLATDIPAPGEYDGDGKTDAAVFRNGIWYLRRTTVGISIQQFGLASDKPIPAAFLQ